MKTILTNLDSSLLEEVSYDNKDEVLEVKFLHSEAIYVYQHVDERDFEEFRSADSLGSHFAKNIRNGYEFEKQDITKDDI